MLRGRRNDRCRRREDAKCERYSSCVERRPGTSGISAAHSFPVDRAWTDERSPFVPPSILSESYP